MTDFSRQIKKSLSDLKISAAQLRKIFSTYKKDLDREWRKTSTYRNNYKYRGAVEFLTKFQGNRLQTTAIFKIPKLEAYIPEKVGRKPKKLLYSRKISDKVGGVELKQLVPKKSTKKKTTAEKRQDSYLATLRQRAIEAQKKKRKKKDFGVKEKASRWGTSGREFQSNKIAYRYGTKGRKTKDPNMQSVSWGTKDPVLKSKKKKNIRYGTVKRALDLDTKQDWGTETKDRPEKKVDNSKTIKEYKDFVKSFTEENFLDKLNIKYAEKILNYLIFKLNR